MSYEINFITQDGNLISIPVLPEKLQVKSPGKDSREEVLGLGEILLPKLRGLRSVVWDSFFPVHKAPYVSGKLTHTPIELIRALQTIRDSLLPFRFQLLGADLDLNIDMFISNLDYEERGLEPGDLYYSIELTEYRLGGAIRLNDDGATRQEEDPQARTGAPALPNSYTVRKGDSLWAIAKRLYGSGTLWRKLYEANKEVVGQNPNLIFPGQVLTIP